ncbi:bifunctional glutamate N-acetyltransferase/amino-acid acetyltransferase ArgJ [Oribacterium sp. WCC10]|uniref:bifunctional glutamate N-acetyltransferase/amino-acid acetyltransferase ArgJ n=1 Tax=Oribacterium sp. WCC10 TaxID=1855343 RepID=UPI000B839C11
MISINGGVCAASGFMAASTAAGIRKKGREDMALIFSKEPCNVAGTFTSNVVKAAPVQWDRNIVDKGIGVHAVVINSGIANACTGKEGMDACKAEALATSEQFGGAFTEESVLVASTGVIGVQLPVDRMKDAITEMVPKLEASEANATLASKAIMTTDTVNKEFAVEFELDGKKVHLGGMTKGSGMIHPRMCTMLCFLTTDVAISKKLLQKALSDDIVDTYNMISVDGDTSTNDTCVILSNGTAGNAEITEENEDYKTFCQALHQVNSTLATRMAADGEGASHLFTVKVVSAKDKDEARTIARSVVSSTLTKTAIYGRDANWGRILCAMGYSGAAFDPEKVNLYFVNDIGKIEVYRQGVPLEFDEDFASEILSYKEVTALIEMNEGSETATAWGCDLTHEYVDINAEYRS